MNFAEFFIKSQEPSFWISQNNICFRGSESSPLFFNMMFRMLEQKNILPAKRIKIDLSQAGPQQIIPMLSQSILGDVNFFWIGELDLGANDKKTKEFSNFILKYQGPNYLSYATTKQESSLINDKACLVTIDVSVSIDLFGKLLKFFDVNLTQIKSVLIKKFFSQVDAVSLDSACMLINYLDLVNIKSADIYLQYLLELFGEKPSLSLLSECFFAKKTTEFFNIWSKVSTEYSDVFWVVFWSEQIWRANAFIKYLSDKKFVEAKRASSRLPYSFTNTYWKMTSVKQLARLYDFLYEIDFKCKSGSMFCSLELFFLKYFNGIVE